MKRGICRVGICVLGMMLLGALAGCGDSAPPKDDVTLANLQKAFNGESNASAKYALYAQKAEEAGYLSVAALFKAASRSEGLHAAREAEVIKAMGAEPQATVVLPAYVDVKTSLEDALAGEAYEFTTMYPEFIKTAKANGSDMALEAFQYALEAEKEHGRFYRAALAELEAWKPAGKEFYVCVVCGYTTDDNTMVTCILCATPKDEFETFR